VIASIVIIIVSSMMFLYFFRYTCLLLMRRGSEEYAMAVASTIRLSFPQVKATLKEQSHTASLDHLHKSLEKDYQLLMDVLGQATGSESIERRILAVDYKVMQTWYKMTRTSRNLAQAKMALSEMSSILTYFAAEIGESAGA